MVLVHQQDISHITLLGSFIIIGKINIDCVILANSKEGKELHGAPTFPGSPLEYMMMIKKLYFKFPSINKLYAKTTQSLK